MKGALAIAAAEVRARHLALWAGLWGGLCGYVMFVVILPRVHPPGPAATAVAVGIGVPLMQMCMAVFLGAGAVSRDLAERRVGFYLARPLSPLAYWAGKMAAAFFLAYAAGWLVLVPGLLGRLFWVVDLSSGMPLLRILFEGAWIVILLGVLSTAFFVRTASW